MRARRGLGAGLALLALAGCGGGTHGSIFAYDRSTPLGLRDKGVINGGYPIKIHDISYASPTRGRVPGYLIVPPGKGPFPAVIYMHGSGGSRADFVPQATWMAARGAVTLTIDDPLARNPRFRFATGLAGLDQLHNVYVQEIVDLRRAVDLLQSLPYVDGKRIAYVGLSAGARMGAVFAGNEPRVRAFDLMSGGGSPASAYVNVAPKSARKRVAKAFEGLDNLAEIRHAHAHFLFQDGTKDSVVPRAELLALARAAPEPKEVRWYKAGHTLNDLTIHDQLRWLAHELGLGGPVVPGAVTGP